MALLPRKSIPGTVNESQTALHGWGNTDLENTKSYEDVSFLKNTQS